MPRPRRLSVDGKAALVVGAMVSFALGLSLLGSGSRRSQLEGSLSAALRAQVHQLATGADVGRGRCTSVRHDLYRCTARITRPRARSTVVTVDVALFGRCWWAGASDPLASPDLVGCL